MSVVQIAFDPSSYDPPPHRVVTLWTLRKGTKIARAIIRLYPVADDAPRPPCRDQGGSRSSRCKTLGQYLCHKYVRLVSRGGGAS
jgi:hypothetical protein